MYFIFGGNGHNDTTYSLGSKCFTSDVLVYDISCESWTTLHPPGNILADISRYGHSVVTYQNAIYLYGGFNGIIQKDLIRFNPTSCNFFTNQKECINSVKYGVKCNWNKDKEICENFGSGLLSSKEKEKDKEKETNTGCISGGEKKQEDNCLSFSSCSTCLQNKFDCVWCGGHCQYSKCKDARHKVNSRKLLENLKLFLI